MRKLLILPLLAIALVGMATKKEVKSKVLTLATLHNNHNSSKYTYADLINVIHSYKPDLICVEIREKEFREEIYLREMMLATSYGDNNNIPVAPIDWWDDSHNLRQERDSLLQLDSYKAKVKQSDSLEANSEVFKQFYSKYGKKFRKSSKSDLYFWNGEDYASYNRETYRITFDVFGDGPFSLDALKRNKVMVDNIRNAISRYGAKRVVVLTGSEHKSFFDDSLRVSPGIEVVSLTDIKKIKTLDFNKVLEKESASRYFNHPDSSKVEDYYSSLVLPYVHGFFMDFDISYINLKTLGCVEQILKSWQKEQPHSITLMYEWVWYHFLNGEYDKAIEEAQQFVNSKVEKKVWYDYDGLRLLGLCYDMKKERAKAVEYYKKAKEEMVKMKVSAEDINSLISNYENTPFTRK